MCSSGARTGASAVETRVARERRVDRCFGVRADQRRRQCGPRRGSRNRRGYGNRERGGRRRGVGRFGYRIGDGRRLGCHRSDQEAVITSDSVANLEAGPCGPPLVFAGTEPAGRVGMATSQRAASLRTDHLVRNGDVVTPRLWPHLPNITLALLRVVTGLLFMEHGIQKFFGILVPPGQPAMPSPGVFTQLWFAGTL